MSGRSAKGLWDHQRSWHINRLEMMAVFRALKYFLPDLRGHHVLVLLDNALMVSYIRADILLRQGLRPGEWRLHPEVVELLWENFGQDSSLLFASFYTTHCSRGFSLTRPALLELDATY